jgi:hypothetical protein
MPKIRAPRNRPRGKQNNIDKGSLNRSRNVRKWRACALLACASHVGALCIAKRFARDERFRG